MAIQTGNIGTAKGGADTRIRNVIMGQIEEERNRTPLFALTDHLARRSKRAVPVKPGWKPEWHTIGAPPRFLSVTNTPGTGTSIVCTDTNWVQVNQVLEYGGENMLVTANDTSTLTLTVTRNTPSRPGGATVSIPSGAKVQIVSTAAEQGAAKGSRYGILPSGDYNFTQIFRRGTGITKTEAAAAQYNTSNTFEDNIRYLTQDIKEEWERGALMHWGLEQLAAGSGGRTHDQLIMAGLPYYLRNNFIDAGGGATFGDFNHWIQRILLYTSGKNLTILAGDALMSLASEWPVDAIRTTKESKWWGRDITMLKGTNGWQAQLVPSYQMEGPQWGGSAFVLDMNYIHKYEYRALNVDQDTATPGDDAKEAELIMESSLIVQNARAHLFITGLEY